MKKLLKISVLLFALGLVLLVIPHKIMANEFNYEELLEQGLIDDSVSQEEWDQFVLSDESANIDDNNGEAPLAKEPNSNMLRSSWGGYNMQKGDILVTGNGSGGISGHAGIAISAEHILTINGYGNTTTLEPLSTWMKKNAGSKGTTWVRRLKNTTIAYKAGDWAYKNYWNASGGTKQTIRPSYGFSGSRYGKNPTYCSKIVLQAYYFGSGSAPVVKVFPSLVAPRDLHTYFSSSYYPYQVAKK